jgi:hypothetical protein
VKGSLSNGLEGVAGKRNAVIARGASSARGVRPGQGRGAQSNIHTKGGRRSNVARKRQRSTI